MASLIKKKKGNRLYYYLVDRKSTRLNSSHSQISYAVFCLKKKIVFLARPLPNIPVEFAQGSIDFHKRMVSRSCSAFQMWYPWSIQRFRATARSSSENSSF